MGAGGREERVVGVAAMQFSCTNDLETNVSKAERYLPTYQCHPLHCLTISLNAAMPMLEYNSLPGMHTSNWGRFHRILTHIGVLGLLQSPAMLKAVFPSLTR